jgi:hypothetical protein
MGGGAVSDVDRQLRDALRDSVEPPVSADVLERVAARRDHRRRARQQRWAAAALVVVLVGAGAVLATTGGGPSTHVAAPGSRVVPGVRVIGGDEFDGSVEDAGRDANVARLRISPDEGYVRGPILAAGSAVAFATYDRAATGFTFPPSRIVRVRVPDGTVIDEVELQGEIVALADGEGARWVLTRDKEVIGPDDPRFRVKRVAPDGTVISNAVPPAEEPTGEIVAAGGGVWVPVRDGVLRFDPVSGAHVSRVSLPPAASRGIAAGAKAVYVTSGTSLYRLDPASDRPVLEHDGAGTLIDLANGDDAALAELVIGGDGRARVDIASTPATIALPGRLDAGSLESANGVVWVDGTLAGSRVAVVLDRRLRSIDRIVVLPADAVLGFVSRDRAVIAAGGEAWIADLAEEATPEAR